MAREDDDDALPPIGEDTTKFLEEAKKGKPRSFLMICKGVNLRYLLVKKKAIKKSEIADAKKLGYKGEAYIGVITGKGMELVFNLSTADGYDSEPCKEKVLKDFLEEHAEIKAKPSFAIVSSLPEIPFDDEDLNHPLVQRFLGLAEQITKVLDAKPEIESEISNRTQAIRGLLQDGNFNQAEPLVNELENQLKTWLSGQSEAGQSVLEAGNESTTTDQSQDPLRTKLQEALNKLVPQLKQAVATYPDKKVELLTPVAEAKKQIEVGDYQKAKETILSVGGLLKSLTTSTQTTANSVSDEASSLAGQYQEKLSATQPLYDKALAGNLGDPSKYRAVMAYAIEQAAAGGYGNAIKALDKLFAALQGVVTTSGASSEESEAETEEEEVYIEPDEPLSPVSWMKLGKARLELANIQSTSIEQIQAVREAVREEFADDEEQAMALAEAIQRLDDMIQDFRHRLFDELDMLLNAKEEDRPKFQALARVSIKDFVKLLDVHPIASVLDGNEFIPETYAIEPLQEKLNEIHSILA